MTTKAELLEEAKERLDSLLRADNDSYEDSRGVGSYEDDLAFYERVIAELERPS